VDKLDSIAIWTIINRYNKIKLILMLPKLVNLKTVPIVKTKLSNKFQVKMERTKTLKITIVDTILIFHVKLLLNFIKNKKK
jgi:hypothetical protein